ncbi:hypothetical protein [Streptomyces sp. NPDC058872]
MLLSTYARCITGQIAGLQQRDEGPPCSLECSDSSPPWRLVL